MSDLVIFEDDTRQVEVRLEGDTVWLAQRQMGELFGTTAENVLMHLKNVFRDGELDESATTKDFLAVRQEGSRRVKRRLKHYNLDAIISVGYRVSSMCATRFRLKEDGWYQVRQRGSHRQFRHPVKSGTVTVSGKANVDMPPGTLNNALKQAGLKK